MRHAQMEKYYLDEIDKTILEMLEDDGRTSVTDIAHMANVSRQTINTRIGAMKDAGIIEGFRVIINRDLIEG